MTMEGDFQESLPHGGPGTYLLVEREGQLVWVKQEGDDGTGGDRSPPESGMHTRLTIGPKNDEIPQELLEKLKGLGHQFANLYRLVGRERKPPSDLTGG
jgi:hypothetical protein